MPVVIKTETTKLKTAIGYVNKCVVASVQNVGK